MSQMTLSGSDELELFYKQKFYFSYSGINKLLFSPIAFYNHYILNQREDSTDAHLVAGRVLHCLLLDPEKFDEDFIVLPGKLPSGNNKTVVDDIFKFHMKLGNHTLELEDYKQEILTQLLAMNLHQALKTDQQRIDKILTEENKEYFNFLKISTEKTVIDQTTLDGCKVSVQLLKVNREVASLLQLDEDERDTDTEVHNELLLAGSIGDLPFGIKGVLDNVVIDHASKTLFVNDLKTTGKPIQDFKDAVEYYRYWIQAVIYVRLAVQKYIPIEHALEWTVQVTFIVIDKYNQVYPFQVSLETLASWQERFETEIVPQIKWHYENRRYDLPYELAIGNVKL